MGDTSLNVLSHARKQADSVHRQTRHCAGASEITLPLTRLRSAHTAALSTISTKLTLLLLYETVSQTAYVQRTTDTCPFNSFLKTKLFTTVDSI